MNKSVDHCSGCRCEKAAEDCTHSKTLREELECTNIRQVLECVHWPDRLGLSAAFKV
jgi:hypothetical protein